MAFTPVYRDNGPGSPSYHRGPLQAVMVDWAGTIVDWGSRAPVEAFRSAFAGEGIEITIAEARAPMGQAKRDHIRAVTRMPRVADLFRARHGRDCTEQDVDRYYQRFLPVQLSVLADHAAVIPGAVEAFAAFRARGLKIGSSTGYTRELMDVLVPAAAAQGLTVDAMACASDVPAGRPAPYLCFANAMRLGIQSLGACVKIGDTVADIGEGRNAGMWTVGVTRSGNEVGLSLDEQRALDPEELARLVAIAELRLARAGAHYLADSIADCPAIVDEIAARVASGARP